MIAKRKAVQDFADSIVRIDADGATIQARSTEALLMARFGVSRQSARGFVARAARKRRHPLRFIPGIGG